MQIARPALTGRMLGSTPNPAHQAPFVDFRASRRVYGTRDGWTSFEQALIGTMHATLGERAPAAVIVKLKGRFFAQGVDVLVDGTRSESLRFERDPAPIADVEPSDPSVVAFVDGLSSLVFGNPTRP